MWRIEGEREREREREKENREIGWTGFELSFYELDCEQEQSAYKIDHDKFLFWFLCKKRENRERERGEIKEMGVVFVKVNWFNFLTLEMGPNLEKISIYSSIAIFLHHF